MVFNDHAARAFGMKRLRGAALAAATAASVVAATQPAASDALVRL